MNNLGPERDEAVRIGQSVLSASYTGRPFSEALTDARARLWRSVLALRETPLSWPGEVVDRMKVVRDDIDGIAEAAAAGPDPQVPWWQRWLRTGR